jgi:exonuclease VII small subunit
MADPSVSSIQQVLGEMNSTIQALGEGSKSQLESAKALTEAVRSFSQAMRESSSTAKDQGRAVESSVNQITQAYGKLDQATKTFGEDGKKSAKEVKQSLEGVGDSLEKVNKTMRESSWDKFAQVFTKLASVGDKYDAIMVKMNQTMVDSTNAFGLMGNSTKDLLTGMAKLDNVNGRVSLSMQELNESINAITLSSRLSYDEALNLSKGMSQVGIGTAVTKEIFEDTGGALGIVNAGLLDLNETSSLVQDAIAGMGKSSEEAKKQLLGIAGVTTKVNEGFGKGTYSAHQMRTALLGLQQSLRYVETDITRLPAYLGSFAAAAKQFKQATGRGISQEAAVQLAQQQMGAVAGMGIAHAAFFGQEGGMGGGLLAGERFLALDPTEKAKKMQQILMRQSGSEAISSVAAIQGGEGAAEKRAQQAALVGKFMGMGEPQARAFLDVISKQGGVGQVEIEAALKSKEEASRDEMVGYLKKASFTAVTQLKTVAQMRDDLHKIAANTLNAMTEGWAGVGAKILSTLAIIGGAMTVGSQIKNFTSGMGGPGGAGGGGGVPGGPRAPVTPAKTRLGRFRQRVTGAGRSVGRGLSSPTAMYATILGSLGISLYSTMSAAEADEKIAKVPAAAAGKISQHEADSISDHIDDQFEKSQAKVETANATLIGGSAAVGIGTGLAGAMRPGVNATLETGADVTKASLLSKIPGVNKAMELASRASGVISKVPYLGAGLGVASKGLNLAGRALGPIGMGLTGIDEIQAAREGRGPESLFGDSYLGEVGDNLTRMSSGLAFGPLGMAAMGVGMAGVRGYGAYKAIGGAREGEMQGVDLASNRHRNQDQYQSMMARRSYIYKDLAKDNVGFFGGSRSFESEYSGASEEQKAAMDEAFERYFGAKAQKDVKGANAYMGAITSFAPHSEKQEDILKEWLKQKGISGSPMNAGDAARIAEDIEKVKQKANKDEEAKKASKVPQHTDHQLLAPINVMIDGDVITRIIAKTAINKGMLAPGPSSQAISQGL